MSDFRHLERPRSRPEFFGLATLDTVTCALAGGIVLMILMAALTDRRAPVKLTPLRAIFESGEAKDPTPAERVIRVRSGGGGGGCAVASGEPDGSASVALGAGALLLAAFRSSSRRRARCRI